MYEVINLNTHEQEGIFPTCAAAIAWIDAHGNREDFRIFPW